jgi:hypothetical protein
VPHAVRCMKLLLVVPHRKIHGAGTIFSHLCNASDSTRTFQFLYNYVGSPRFELQTSAWKTFIILVDGRLRTWSLRCPQTTMLTLRHQASVFPSLFCTSKRPSTCQTATQTNKTHRGPKIAPGLELEASNFGLKQNFIDQIGRQLCRKTQRDEDDVVSLHPATFNFPHHSKSFSTPPTSMQSTRTLNTKMITNVQRKLAIELRFFAFQTSAWNLQRPKCLRGV